jgi:hypothetical protein
MECLRRKGSHWRRVAWRPHARIGNKLKPMSKLSVQAVEIAEKVGEVEVFTDIPIRPFDLGFGLSVVGTTGPGLEKVWGRAAKVVAPSSSKRRWRLPRGTNQRSQPKPRGV